MKLNKYFGASLAAAASLLAMANVANAATATDTFQSRIVIQAECKIQATNTLDFGTNGVLDAAVDASANFDVQCTDTTAYNVGLDAGTTTGGTIATRKMDSGSATVDYNMYSDSGRTTNWGETIGTDTVAGTGNGAAQTLTVYGRVPAQTTPAAGTYTDTVTITVTY